MYPESIPIDYTGYGPTGTGYRPTVGAMRRQMENKYRTNRNADMMSYVDPSVNAAVGVASRAFMGADNDPAKVRDYMNNSAQGQMIRDGAMMMRRNGMLGAGNPINYSHNITRGITGGGFTTDIVGRDPNGRSMLGLDQRVQGNGLLAERVTQRFQKGLLDNLYGKDQLADPSKLSGFDMEEASGVAATIMRRGGVGKAATYIKGADAQTRVNAARDAATPEMRDKLAGVNVGSNAELAKLAESTQDPKLKKELTRLAQSTDAVVTNDAASKKVAGVVKEVTKGMAALSDMYGELSSTELHQMLESVSGQQITNKQQARHAARMVNEMRNGAEAAGMDPRAFMDYAQQSQAGFNQAYDAAAGRDGRTGTYSKAATANLHGQIMKDSLAGAKTSENAAAYGREHGIAGMEGTAKNADEIAADMKQQTLQQIERSQGEAMLRGRINEFDNPEERAKVEALLATQASTTDASQRYDNEQQLRALAGRKFGGVSQTFEAAAASRAGRLGMDRGNVDATQVESGRRASLAALNTSTIDNLGMSKLGMDATQAGDFSRLLMDKLGSKMTDVHALATGPDQIGDQKISAADRKNSIRAYLTKEAQMSEDQARNFSSTMLDDNGRFKDQKVAEDLMGRVANTSWGDKAAAERTAEVNAALAQRGMNGARDKIGANGDGKITTSAIVNAMLNKSVGGAENPEVMALTLAAMKGEGVEGLGGVETDINMSENISVEAAEKLTKANGGKDLGLLKKFGYKDNADMAEKTKDPFERKKVLDFLDDNTDLNLTGDLKNTTAISDAALATAANGDTAAAMRKRVGALALSGGIEGANYTADAVGYKTSEKWFSGGRQFTHMENNRKFVTAAQNINSADAETMKNIGEVNKDGTLGKSMEEQLKALKQAEAFKIDTVIARDPTTGKEVTNNTADSIAKLEAAIAKLAGATAVANGSSAVQEMRVTHLHIDNVADLKKS